MISSDPILNDAEYEYLDLLSSVAFSNMSVRKSIYGHNDRYLMSQIGNTLRFDMSEGFPIFTTRQIAYKNAFREMLWFIKGNSNLAELHHSGCNWWNEWGRKIYNKTTDKHLTSEEFEEFLNTKKDFYINIHYSNITNYHYVDGITGKYEYLDQTKWVIDEFSKNPDRKSYVVNYWQPEKVYQMADYCNNESVVLPACHFYHQLLMGRNNTLTLIVGIRSSDLYFGLPANVAQYALLLYMYSHCLKIPAGELVIQLGDHHVYDNVLEQIEEQIKRDPLEFPTIEIVDRGQKYLTDFVFSDFIIKNYNHLGKLPGELTIVGGYD